VLVITAATSEELRETLKIADIKHYESHAGMHFFFGQLGGRDILIVQTGVGPKRAGAAANKILQAHAPAAVIAVGAAGAADPSLCVGDIVIAKTILHHAGGQFPADERRSEKIAAQLRAQGMPVSCGDCFTTGTFIHTARQKQLIFQNTGARVIDMESASLIKRLHPAGVAFVNIRIISDTARQDAFNIEYFYGYKKKAGGFGAYAYFMQNPKEILRAASLRKNVRLVGKRIAAILEIILERTD